MNIQISRREALLGSSALIVSFSLAGPIEQATAQASTKPVVLNEVDFVPSDRQKRKSDRLFGQSGAWRQAFTPRCSKLLLTSLMCR